MDKPYEKKPEEEIKCEHKLGYLKALPKDTPIPTECLSCPKIIECKHSYLARKPTEQNTNPEPVTEFISLTLNQKKKLRRHRSTDPQSNEFISWKIFSIW